MRVYVVYVCVCVCCRKKGKEEITLVSFMNMKCLLNADSK